MSSLFTIHTANVNGTPHYFLCKPVTYEGLGNKVGIEEANGEVGNIPLVRVSQLLRRQRLVRVTLYYVVLVGNRERRRIAKLLCHPDKKKAFMFSAPGMNYRGGVVTTAHTPTNHWRNRGF